MNQLNTNERFDAEEILITQTLGFLCEQWIKAASNACETSHDFFGECIRKAGNTLNGIDQARELSVELAKASSSVE